MGGMLQKVQQLQEEMVKAQDALADETVSVTAGGGAIEVTIMNCGMLAKMLYPKGPDIRIDDGYLDVLIFGTKPVRDYPLYVFRLLTGRTPDILSRFIKVERCVTIRSSVPLPVQADGDMIGTTPLEVELLPGAVTVLVPEGHVIDPALDSVDEAAP